MNAKPVKPTPNRSKEDGSGTTFAAERTKYDPIWELDEVRLVHWSRVSIRGGLTQVAPDADIHARPTLPEAKNPES